MVGGGSRDVNHPVVLLGWGERPGLGELGAIGPGTGSGSSVGKGGALASNEGTLGSGNSRSATFDKPSRTTDCESGEPIARDNQRNVPIEPATMHD